MKAGRARPEIVSRIGPAVGPAVLVLGLGLLACFALSISSLSSWITWLLIALTLAYAARSGQQLLRPTTAAVSWLNDALLLEFANGKRLSCSACPGSFVSPVFIALRVRDGSGRRRRIGLFRSQVNEAFWRHSMIRLRTSPLA